MGRSDENFRLGSAFRRVNLFKLQLGCHEESEEKNCLFLLSFF